MDDVERDAIDLGTMAVLGKERFRKRALRRYRPINAEDDIVEISGKEFDEFVKYLDAVRTLADTVVAQVRTA